MTQEFFRPIVTPFELQIALGVAPTWDGRYLLEFEKVLGETGVEPVSEDAFGEDEPEFSLVTGKYRQVKKYGDQNSAQQVSNEQGGALVQRTSEGSVITALVSAAGQYALRVAGQRLRQFIPGQHLSGRSWRGLEQNLGQDEPGLLERGRTGLAKGYHELALPQGEDVP